MTSDIDVHRAATLLLDRYGDCAAVEAARHAFMLHDCGDLEGYRVWTRITVAIGVMVEARQVRWRSEKPDVLRRQPRDKSYEKRRQR